MSVNFLNTDQEKLAQRKTVIFAALFTFIVGGIAFAGAAASYRSVQHGTSVFAEFIRLPGIRDARKFVFGDELPAIAGIALSGEDKNPDILTVLLLGIGGAGHDGANLTDTIIIASINTKDHRVNMLSIPRDTAFPNGRGGYEKINAVHAWEERDHPGEGAVRTAKIFSDFFGISIDHVVRVDFNGFAKLVDALGGVTIDVERSFTDTSYPAADDKYQTISFKKGVQTMDGETALQYARSRHGSNGEGSDFARAKRQQLVIVAIREKLLSLNTLADPTKLAKLYQVVSNHLQSDMSPWEAFNLAPIATDINKDEIQQHVLTDAPDGELVPANINGSFLLFPKGGDWTRIKSLAQNPFNDDIHTPVADIPKVEVKNGTFKTGMAFQIANRLGLEGYSAESIGNASSRQYERTVIFDLTNGSKVQELVKLKEFLNADVSLTAATTSPQNPQLRSVFAQANTIETIASTDTDFLVILGESSYSLMQPTQATNYVSTTTNP